MSKVDQAAKVATIINDGNWQSAFEFSQPPTAVVGQDVSTTLFTLEDIKKVIAVDDGENEEADWIGVFQLKDGRFAFVSAGCDATGWD